MGIAKMTNKLSLLLQKPNAFHNLSVAQLVEKILQRNEGKLTATGAVAVTTGKYTGRSPKDKYIVEEAATKEKIDWGTTNQPISEEVFENLYNKVLDYLMKKRKYLFSKDSPALTQNTAYLSKLLTNWHGTIYLPTNYLFVRQRRSWMHTKQSLPLFARQILKQILLWMERDRKRLLLFLLNGGSC